MDLNRKQFKTEFAGKLIALEISKLAGQADAAVLGTYGGTTVLATVVIGKKESKLNYFPLMVNYEERFYAAGKILGSRFIRREGRPSDEAILNGRLIDRIIRPLFNQNLRREIQVVVTVLSVDGENEPEFIGLLAASTALNISPIPWNGPAAGVKILKLKNQKNFLINPTTSAATGEEIEFSAFVAGIDERINMIELEGNEAKESDILDALASAQKEIKKLADWQKEISKEISKEKIAVSTQADKKLEKIVAEFLEKRLLDAVYHPDKTERQNKIGILNGEMKIMLAKEKYSEEEIVVSDAIFEEEINKLIHEQILKNEKRPDGRRLNQVRELYAEAGLFKNLHGSALFIRGNTQSLAAITLGAPRDQQLVETMEFSGKRHFLLHYNFPAYSVGEIGPFRGPGRREIGHGALAEKALRALLPSKEEFPYTIRVVSEILSSNGSSSMATVCATSLSLMDAGVPIKKPAAGIAMGLVLDEKGEGFKVLTDIQGPEDHHGDMDCKVAGTDSGVTAMQMDVKIQGLTIEMLEKTLAQAKEARLHILETMNKTLSAPRKELSPFAPMIITLRIDPSRIGEIIGPGGKVINGIIKDTGVISIDIEDDGTVLITAQTAESAQKARDQIKMMVKEYNIGDVIEGKVSKILEFGAIVDFDGRDGMIHISELKDGYVKKVEEVLKAGDFVRAKIIKAENGKIGLSLKQMKGIN